MWVFNRRFPTGPSCDLLNKILGYKIKNARYRNSMSKIAIWP